LMNTPVSGCRLHRGETTENSVAESRLSAPNQPRWTDSHARDAALSPLAARDPFSGFARRLDRGDPSKLGIVFAAWPVRYALAPKGSVRFGSGCSRCADWWPGNRSRFARKLRSRGLRFSHMHCEPAVWRPSFILFEHNVEIQIWRRYGERGEDALRRWYGGTSHVRQIVCTRSSARRVHIRGLHRTWKKALTSA
jgi:hypothetical protein